MPVWTGFGFIIRIYRQFDLTLELVINRERDGVYQGIPDFVAVYF
jgi:hypothetical protein